ncbi:hypothetical protein LMIY3S_00215 [Labrys miyagiensis]
MEDFAFPRLGADWSRCGHHTDSSIFLQAWALADWEGATQVDHLGFHESLDRESKRLRREWRIRALPGAPAFVVRLREKGWMVAFATGGLRQASRTKLEAAGISFDDGLLATASEHLTLEGVVAAAVSHHGAVPTRIVSMGDGL